ncbi:MAG: ABC transporter permease [Clostridiales bacterium]
MLICFNIFLNNIKRLITEPLVIIFVAVIPLFGVTWAMLLISNSDFVDVAINYRFSENHRFVRVITNNNKFSLYYCDEKDIESSIKNGIYDLGIILPKDFEFKMENNIKPNIKILSLENGSLPIYLRFLVEEYVYSKKLNIPKTDIAFCRSAYNNISIQKISIGFMMMSILMFVGSNIYLIIEDRRKNIIFRILDSPIHKYEYIFGNILTTSILGIIHIGVFLFFSTIVLNIDWKVSNINMFIILYVFYISSIGINIGLIALVKNKDLYIISNVIISIFSSIMGGSCFSYSLMGKNLERTSNFFPQKWVIISYEKLVDGESFDKVLINLIILILFGIVFSNIGTKSLKNYFE